MSWGGIGYEGEFVVDWSVSERVLVAREGFRVAVSAIGAGDAAFIIASALNGAPLGAAVAKASEASPDFDHRAFLARAIASDLISGFTIDT